MYNEFCDGGNLAVNCTEDDTELLSCSISRQAESSCSYVQCDQCIQPQTGTLTNP